MKPSLLPCNRDLLHGFVDQRLQVAEQRLLEDHLSECAACRDALEALIADPQVWSDARSRLAEPAEQDPHDHARDALECYRSLLGPTDDPRMIGRIGTHEIVGVLGVGGMGVVFKGFDPSLNRYVAIKMLSPLLHASGVAKQRFLREAQSAAAVIHDNVVAIHSIDRWRDAPYLVMTYVRGESLRTRLARRGALSVREVLRVGMQMASGLAAAHSQGLIHRDIKPANVLLETDVDRVKISDFGLARAVDDIRLTQSDVLIGTPQYMSPEQARDDELDYRTDLFSLGSVLYEACTGRAPFYASTSYGVLRRIIEHRPLSIRQLNSDVPDWLEPHVERLMEKDRDLRFSNASEVEALLRQCLAHVEQPHLMPLPAALATPSRNGVRVFFNRWRIPMSVAAVGLVLGLGWVLVAHPGQGNQEAPASQPEQRTTSEARAKANSRGGPTTEAGYYKITVLGTADVKGMPMTPEFDLSRMSVDQNSQTFGGSGGGGFTGGAVGGSTATFFKPNLGIVLQIEPTSPKADGFVKLSTKVTAVDDLGQKIESKDLGPNINHFAQFENEWPDRHYLYVYRAGKPASQIARLDGELLITPGRKLSVAFDGTKRQTKRAETFKLESVSTNADRIQVKVKFPVLKSVDQASTPQERFQAMVANRGAYSAVIEDSEGDVHAATGAANAGGGGGMTTSFAITNTGAQGFAKSGDNATQTFTFPPLPNGRTIKSIRAVMEERTGDAKKVPFKLENIPLK